MIKIFKVNNKTGFTLWELAVVILLVWLFATLVPSHPFRNSHPHYTELKACFSNQRVLIGAIEMYNLDHVNMLDTAFPGREFDDIIKLLNDGHYLKGDLTSKDNICSYGFIDLKGNGNTFCVTHGAIDPKNTFESDENPYYPQLDSNSKCTRIKEYEDLKFQMRKESKKNLRKKAIKVNLKELFLETPALPAFLLVIVFCIAIWNYFSDLKNKKSKGI